MITIINTVAHACNEVVSVRQYRQPVEVFDKHWLTMIQCSSQSHCLFCFLYAIMIQS